MRVSSTLLLLITCLCEPWEATAACLLHPEYVQDYYNKIALAPYKTSAFGFVVNHAVEHSASKRKEPRLRFPQIALKATSLFLLAYGIAGLLYPETLHCRLFGYSLESLTDRVQVRYVVFAVREFVMAIMSLWLSSALKSTKNSRKDNYLPCIIFFAFEIALVPYLFGSIGRDRGDVLSKAGLAEPQAIISP